MRYQNVLTVRATVIHCFDLRALPHFDNRRLTDIVEMQQDDFASLGLWLFSAKRPF
jgi:hypothetical protein